MDKTEGPTPEEIAMTLRSSGIRITSYNNSGLFSALKLLLGQRLLDVEETEDVVKRRVGEVYRSRDIGRMCTKTLHC